MGIFDNAKSILIGSKEVKSIVIGEGTIYEKEVPASTYDLSFTVVGEPITSDPVPLANATVTIGDKSGTTGSAGGCTISGVEAGEYSVTATYSGSSKTETIVVDESHTSFTIMISFSNNSSS